MKWSNVLLMVVCAGAISAMSACTDRDANEAKKNAAVAVDATRAGAEKVAEKTKEVAVATGAAVTDGWITTKLKAKFADETMLKGSDINVDTTDHVVTLSGAVPSAMAKERAVEIAGGTEGVKRVVNQLVVR
jgi:hyperosmotically inducible periplasmic protein